MRRSLEEEADFLLATSRCCFRFGCARGGWFPPHSPPLFTLRNTLHWRGTFAEHTYCVYSAAWSPVNSEAFASASGDCTVKVWDLRRPQSPSTLRAHDFHILSLDWCKYNDFVLATGSVDKSIRVWDIRSPTRPVATLQGHTYAVRRVVFSAHHETLLGSCSYDMSMCLWDYKNRASPLLHRSDHHTEFAVGLDCSMFHEGMWATTGWDELTYVWKQGMDPRA